MADVKVTNTPEKLPVSENDLHKPHKFAVAQGGSPVRLSVNDGMRNIVAMILPGQERTLVVGTQDLFAVATKEAQLTITPL